MDKISLFKGQKFAISEFSRHIEYDFLREANKNNFHTKNQEDSQWRLEVIGPKISKLALNGQNFAIPWPKLPISEFFRHIEYDFLKEDHKNNFHNKKLGRFIAAFGRYKPKTLKNGYFGQKWPNFDHYLRFLGVKKFFDQKLFGGHLSHMET